MISNKKKLNYLKLDSNLFLGYIIVKLKAPAFQNTLTFNHYIINYGTICLLKLDNAISLLPKKKHFLLFLDTKQFFAMKIASHHYKQLSPSKSWDQDGFFCLGLGNHQIQIVGLELLQRFGHQIRVNTWTSSSILIG